MSDIHEQYAALDAARVEYHEAVETETFREIQTRSAAIYQRMADLSAAITEGAAPCPRCGEPPHGMLREQRVLASGDNGESPMLLDLYEIGCLGCRGMRVMGGTPEECVRLWSGHVGAAPKGEN